MAHQLEVILVDDGSPDRCPQICDDLARMDDRIIVIHKTNGGLSAARNSGIEIAKGEYLVFLDSDDQWAEDKLRPLMEQLEKSEVDMLMFRSVSLYPDGKLTFLWNGIEQNYGKYDIINNRKFEE